MFQNYDQEQIASATVFRSLLGDLKSFDLHAIVEDFFGSFWGISRGLTLAVIFTGLFGVLWRQIPDLPLYAFEWVLGTLPIWLLPLAIFGGAKAWIWYARAYQISSQAPILLEVKFPRELVKSPRAMEAALAQMWTDRGETTFFNRV